MFYVVASQAEDRGADAGIFFQQLLLSQELSISPSIILKVLWNWRSDWGSHTMKTMCGSVSAVRRMIGSLISDATLGMIGPARLTWNVKNQGAHEALSYFGRSESARLGMMFSWSLSSMSTSEFPAEKHLWIVTGGCSRASKDDCFGWWLVSICLLHVSFHWDLEADGCFHRCCICKSLFVGILLRICLTRCFHFPKAKIMLLATCQNTTLLIDALCITLKQVLSAVQQSSTPTSRRQSIIEYKA